MYVSYCDEKRRENAYFYCLKKYTQLSKHLHRIHKNEKRVKELMTFKDRSEEKVSLLKSLRTDGNAKFNESREANLGELIVTKRCRKSSVNVAMDYTVCVVCKDTFSKKGFRRHFRICSQKDNKKRNDQAAGRFAADRILELEKKSLYYVVMKLSKLFVRMNCLLLMLMI